MALNAQQQQQVQEQLERVRQAAIADGSYDGSPEAEARVQRQAVTDVALANGLDPNQVVAEDFPQLSSTPAPGVPPPVPNAPGASQPPGAPTPLNQPAVRDALGNITQDPNVSAGLQAGADLGNEFFGEGSLGRIGVDPTTQSFIDRNLVASRNLAIDAENLDPLSVDSIARAGRLNDQANQVAAEGGSQAIRDLISSAQTQFDQSGQISPELQAALAERQARLGGLTDQEITLLREGNQESLNRGLQTALRAANINSGASGRFGGTSQAASPEIARQFAQGIRQSEGDIGRFNIGLRDARLGAFENLAGSIDAARFNRGQSTFGNLANLTTGNEANLMNNQLNTLRQFNTNTNAIIDAQNANRLATQQVSNQNAFNTANLGLGVQNTNLGLGAAEKAGNIGTIFGVGAFSAGEAGRLAAEEQARRAIDAARAI